MWDDSSCCFRGLELDVFYLVILRVRFGGNFCIERKGCYSLGNIDDEWGFIRL